MSTREMGREQISMLADGELDDRQLDAALTALRQQGGREDWEIYHQIGDVLRSDDMAIALSPEFSARMAARLEAEPAIIAPVMQNADAASERFPKRWAVPGLIAAAAMASIAFVTTPQLMVALKGGASSVGDTSTVAAAPIISGEVIAASATEGVVLRDPGIDDYLLAHQRFSPSVYSTAQYARSATFASDTSK